MKIYRSLKFPQKGLTLIEVLLALAVGSLLLMGLSQIFIGNKNTYRIQENLSRLQENARYVFDSLSRDIRMANYLGCAQKNYNMNDPLASSAYRNILYEKDDPRWDFQRGMLGFEAIDGGFSPNIFQAINEPDQDSDIISIKIIRGSGLRLSSDVDTNNNTGSLQVAVNNSTPLDAGDLAIITDCTTTTAFKATGFNQGTGVVQHAQSNNTSAGNSSDNLEYPFLTGASVFPIETVTYYVKEGTLYRRVDDKGNTNNNSGSQPLIDGVENIQITYGVDLVRNDERADAYLTADQVNSLDASGDPVRSWRKVVSVRIGLLMRTVDEVASEVDTSTYTVNNEMKIDPVDDRRLRRVFLTTVALRNRLP